MVCNEYHQRKNITCFVFKIFVVYNNTFANFLVIHIILECGCNNSVLVTERGLWLLFFSILLFSR